MHRVRIRVNCDCCYDTELLLLLVETNDAIPESCSSLASAVGTRHVVAGGSVDPVPAPLRSAGPSPRVREPEESRNLCKWRARNSDIPGVCSCQLN